MSGWWTVLLVACSEPEPVVQAPPAAPEPEPIDEIPDSPTTSFFDSGTIAPTGPDCDALPEGPFGWVATSRVHTEEDFDFDRAGYLVMQSSSNLLGVTRDGVQRVLATNIGYDIAGVRSLPTDDYVVAQQDTAALRRVNHANGNTVTVLGGLEFPNGIDVDTTGMVYVSEYVENGRIRQVDPYSGDATVILDARYPNGLALSPDEATLYVVLSSEQFTGQGRVVAIDRDPTSGVWSPDLRIVFEASDLLDAITVDTCGNVYVIGYRTGKVWRIRMPEGNPELIVDLPNSGWEGYCAARFGAGYGGWDRTTLYVSDRTELYGIELGIEGRHVLAAAP